MEWLIALMAVPIFFVLFITTIVLISLLFFAFWIWMLVDCLTRNDWKGSEQIAWVLVIVFVGWLGALIYLFAIKLSRDGKKQKSRVALKK